MKRKLSNENKHDDYDHHDDRDHIWIEISNATPKSRYLKDKYPPNKERKIIANNGYLSFKWEIIPTLDLPTRTGSDGRGTDLVIIKLRGNLTRNPKICSISRLELKSKPRIATLTHFEHIVEASKVLLYEEPKLFDDNRDQNKWRLTYREGPIYQKQGVTLMKIGIFSLLPATDTFYHCWKEFNNDKLKFTDDSLKSNSECDTIHVDILSLVSLIPKITSAIPSKDSKSVSAVSAVKIKIRSSRCNNSANLNFYTSIALIKHDCINQLINILDLNLKFLSLGPIQSNYKSREHWCDLLITYPTVDLCYNI